MSPGTPAARANGRPGSDSAAEREPAQSAFVFGMAFSIRVVELQDVLTGALAGTVGGRPISGASPEGIAAGSAFTW
jgi:hypothetical protein